MTPRIGWRERTRPSQRPRTAAAEQRSEDFMTTAVASKAKPTQKQRALAVQIEGLKFDRLLLQALSGSEGLSRLFHFDLEMLSELGDHVDPQDVVGKKVSVRLSEKGRKTRYFVGYINRF